MHKGKTAGPETSLDKSLRLHALSISSEMSLAILHPDTVLKSYDTE